MKKTTTQIGAVSAAALIASMGIVPFAALGQENTPGINPTVAPKDLVLAKTINASPAIDTAGKEFVFNFEPTNNVTMALNPGANAADDIDAYTDGKAAFTVTLKASAMTGAKQQLAEKLPFHEDPYDDDFTHAGLYEYIVSEVSPGTGWESNTEKYVLRIYVVNDDSAAHGLAYNTVTVTKATEGDDGATSAGNKVSATTADGVASVPGSDESATATPNTNNTINSEGAASGFVFTNTADFSTQKGNLIVSKATTGQYADKTHKFPFSIAINVPASVAAADYAVTFTGGEAKAAAAASDSNIDNNKVNLTGGTEKVIKVELADGGQVQVANLPAGTTYTVTETSTTVNGARYTPSAELNGHSESGTGFSIGGTPVLDVALDASDEAHDTPAEVTMIPAGANSTAAFTNTLTDAGQPSPTGIVTMFAPYALLLVAGGVAAYVVVRNRKKNQEEE